MSSRPHSQFTPPGTIIWDGGLVSSEPCEHCGQPSSRSHPGGVVTGNWRCYLCGRWQNERPAAAATEPTKQIEEA